MTIALGRSIVWDLGVVFHDLFLNDCQLKSTIVVSPTILLVNDFSDNSFCGFNSCSIYSTETWDITYESGSTFVLINQTLDINFCGGEADETDTSLQLTVNFQITANRLEISYDLPSSDGNKGKNKYYMLPLLDLVVKSRNPSRL